MNEDTLFEALGAIDEKFVLEAEEEQTVKKVSVRRVRPAFVKVLTAAAGLALIFGGAMLSIRLTDRNAPSVAPESSDPTTTYPTTVTPIPEDSGIQYNEPTQKEENDIANSLRFRTLHDFRIALERHEELGSSASNTLGTDADLAAFKKFFTALRMEKNVIPYLNGSEMKLREGESITFYLSEAYGLPWVFYKPQVATNDNFYISITLVPGDYGVVIGETASSLLRKISPEAPNIGNLGQNHKNIYEKDIKLQDRVVTALVHEYIDDGRNGYLFIYNQMLVWVRCNPEVWDDAWFSGLGFGH